MSKLAKRLWHDESGQDLTEYALLLAMIALFAVASMRTLGEAICNAYANAASNVSSAT